MELKKAFDYRINIENSAYLLESFLCTALAALCKDVSSCKSAFLLLFDRLRRAMGRLPLSSAVTVFPSPPPPPVGTKGMMDGWSADTGKKIPVNKVLNV